MSKLRDKIDNVHKRNSGGGNFVTKKGIYKTWEDNDNEVRLVGEFLEVHTHFLGPNKRQGISGLCVEDAFDRDNEDRIPMVVNCLDWNLDTESDKEIKTCPICALNRAVHNFLDSGEWSSDDNFNVTMLKNLRSQARCRTILKWNILDRDYPYVTITGEGDAEDEEVLGYKVADIGMEAFTDIQKIYKQINPADIASIDGGFDITVSKDTSGSRVKYGATLVFEGTSAKQTPLTDEEKELEVYDLKRLCGKQTDGGLVKSYLREALQDILTEYGDLDDGETPTKKPANGTKAEPKAEPKAEAKAEAKEKVASKPKGKGKGKKEPEKVEELPEPDDVDCFGEIEPEIPECIECEYKERCAVKAGVTLT